MSVLMVTLVELRPSGYKYSGNGVALAKAANGRNVVMCCIGHISTSNKRRQIDRYRQGQILRQRRNTIHQRHSNCIPGL